MLGRVAGEVTSQTQNDNKGVLQETREKSSLAESTVSCRSSGGRYKRTGPFPARPQKSSSHLFFGGGRGGGRRRSRERKVLVQGHRAESLARAQEGVQEPPSG